MILHVVKLILSVFNIILFILSLLKDLFDKFSIPAFISIRLKSALRSLFFIKLF